MNNLFEKKAGLALIIFTILLVFTMVLHPAGGNIEYLIRISGMIMITHAIAILSLPFGWIGFWGLTRKIGTDHFWPMLGFAMVSIGMVAVLIAASTNGLALPIYLQHYKDASPATLESIKPILRYGFAVNHAFDYVYTGTFCLAMLCWSVSILSTKKMAAWIGWLGIVLSLGSAGIFIFGVAVNDLQGLRLFVISIVAWILIVGINLARRPRVLP